MLIRTPTCTRVCTHACTSAHMPTHELTRAYTHVLTSMLMTWKDTTLENQLSKSQSINLVNLSWMHSRWIHLNWWIHQMWTCQRKMAYSWLNRELMVHSLMAGTSTQQDLRAEMRCKVEKPRTICICGSTPVPTLNGYRPINSCTPVLITILNRWH